MEADMGPNRAKVNVKGQGHMQFFTIGIQDL